MPTLFAECKKYEFQVINMYITRNIPRKGLAIFHNFGSIHRKKSYDIPMDL